MREQPLFKRGQDLHQFMTVGLGEDGDGLRFWLRACRGVGHGVAAELSIVQKGREAGERSKARGLRLEVGGEKPMQEEFAVSFPA